MGLYLYFLVNTQLIIYFISSFCLLFFEKKENKIFIISSQLEVKGSEGEYSPLHLTGSEE